MRFKTELLPVQAALVHSLDELVQQTQQRMDALYAETARERSHLMLRIYVLFALLVLFASVITWLFATHAARVYELEKDAHAVAQRALATRDELMGIVAHDLRNPLTSIGLKAALLERLAHTQDLQEGAQSIAGTVRQMERLIASMLDVSVIESGRFFVDPAPCSVDHLLRECVDTFSPLFAARGVRLETRANHRLAVQADDERIQQLMSNLLGNALKYAPPHSIVRIAVVESAGVARFSVSDAGPGIAASHLPHVFDRFWKHEQDGRKGTGLGLFIARGIVDAHGGEIGVESEPGQGATFYFTLRIAQPRTESGRTETDELEAPSPCVGGLVEPATLHAP